MTAIDILLSGLRKGDRISLATIQGSAFVGEYAGLSCSWVWWIELWEDQIPIPTLFQLEGLVAITNGPECLCNLMLPERVGQQARIDTIHRAALGRQVESDSREPKDPPRMAGRAFCG